MSIPGHAGANFQTLLRAAVRGSTGEQFPHRLTADA